MFRPEEIWQSLRIERPKPRKGKERLYVVTLGVPRAIWLLASAMVRPRGIGCVGDDLFLRARGKAQSNRWRNDKDMEEESGHLLVL